MAKHILRVTNNYAGVKANAAGYALRRFVLVRIHRVSRTKAANAALTGLGTTVDPLNVDVGDALGLAAVGLAAPDLAIEMQKQRQRQRSGLERRDKRGCEGFGAVRRCQRPRGRSR